MSVTMNTKQAVDLSLKGVGVNGGDTTAQFTGQATWSSTDAILTLQPAQDALAVRAASLGAVGTSTVTVTAIDAAGRTFTATVDVVVVEAPPEVTDHVEIVAGVPFDL